MIDHVLHDGKFGIDGAALENDAEPFKRLDRLPPDVIFKDTNAAAGAVVEPCDQ